MSTVRREIVLPVERERAWELLTEPRRAARVARRRGRARARGGRAAARGVGERRGPRGRRRGGRGAAPAALPLGRRRDRHPSRVEWTLDDAPGGTRVVVEERPLVPLELRGIAMPWRAARRRRSRPLAHAAAPALRPGTDVDAVFAALADPTRRAVIGRLAQRAGERLARWPASCRSAARRSPSTSPRSTAPGSWRRAARAARPATRSTPAPLGEAMAWMAAVGAQLGRAAGAAGAARAGVEPGRLRQRRLRGRRVRACGARRRIPAGSASGCDVCTARGITSHATAGDPAMRRYRGLWATP